MNHRSAQWYIKTDSEITIRTNWQSLGIGPALFAVFYYERLRSPSLRTDSHETGVRDDTCPWESEV